MLGSSLRTKRQVGEADVEPFTRGNVDAAVELEAAVLAALQCHAHVMLADRQYALHDEAALPVDRDPLAQNLDDGSRRHVTARHRDRAAIHLDVAEGGVVITEARRSRPLFRRCGVERGSPHQGQRPGLVEAALGIIGAQHVDEVVEALRGGGLGHGPTREIVLADLDHHNGRRRGVPAGGEDADFLPRDIGGVVAGGEDLDHLSRREGAARSGGGGIEEGLGVQPVILHLDVGCFQRLVGLAVLVRRARRSRHVLAIDADREQRVARLIRLRQRSAAKQGSRQQRDGTPPLHGAPPETMRVSMARS